jgi:hypothetical protein
MKNVGKFYDHLEFFTAIWYNLWPFGIVCGHLVIFPPFWYVCLDQKNLATLLSICHVSSKPTLNFDDNVSNETFTFTKNTISFEKLRLQMRSKDRPQWDRC